MNCIKNLIVQATGPLLPTVLTAVLNLHKNGQFKISALEVRDECAIMKPTISWRDRIPAICNGMRKLTDCNWRIVSEDRDYNEFTIELSKNIDEKNKSTKSKSTISPQNKRVKPSKKNNNMTKKIIKVYFKHIFATLVLSNSNTDLLINSILSQNDIYKI
jgi:hypothetical protein